MGDRGPQVVQLQERLKQLGLYSKSVDGKYGPAVREAVSRYQSQYGVQGDPSGTYGPNTRQSLESRTTLP